MKRTNHNHSPPLLYLSKTFLLSLILQSIKRKKERKTHPLNQLTHNQSTHTMRGSERDTIALRPLQKSPIPISPSNSLSISLSLNSAQNPNQTLSSSTFSLGSIGGTHMPAGLIDYCANKQALERQLLGEGLENNGGDSDECNDPKRKRLMKNRESAIRSRARKQAFMNELKVEVERLEDENANLRKQCQELKSALAAANLPKKKLRRTTSAQF